MPRDFSSVGVVGLGTMGAGIVEVFARSGHSVTGVERDEESLERGRLLLERSTGRAVRRGKLSADEQAELLGRVRFTTSLSDLGGAGLVVEAVVEQLRVKQSLFRELDRVVLADAVLATNTSSLSVTEIASVTRLPGRVVGMHFFNPAPVQQLVEVVRTVVAEPQLVDDVADLARCLGKTPVTCGDRAGFIANALLFGYLNRAVSMYEARHASREDIDAAMRLGCGYPMGPLELLDLIGLDTACQILDSMYQQGRDRLHAPAPLLEQMVAAGLLGRKAGRGFYTYESPASPVVVPDASTADADDRPTMRRHVGRVGVVGTGLAATGVTKLLAGSGLDVVCVGPTGSEGDAARGMVERAVAAAGSDEANQAVGHRSPGRVAGATRLEDLADVDLVVEATGGDPAGRLTLFERLGEICKPGAILATNSFSLPVVSLARVTGRGADVVGMHFVGSAPDVRLVEVVSTVLTGEEVAQTVRATCADLGTVAVSCGDRAGLVVNALLLPYLNDAVKMAEAQYASAGDIDAAMRYGCALPAGPFEVLDALGNDVALEMQREIYRESREPGLAPAPMLRHLVAAGHLGRKTGRGFRDYATR